LRAAGDDQPDAAKLLSNSTLALRLGAEITAVNALPRVPLTRLGESESRRGADRRRRGPPVQSCRAARTLVFSRGAWF